MMYGMVIVGLPLLFWGGGWVIGGSVSLARKLGVSPLIIGLTVLGFGTSAPEFMVSADAALAGRPGIALGNVIGSNIANVFLVLGLSSLFCTTLCDAPRIRRNTLFVVGASLLFMALCAMGRLVTWHGIVLLLLLALFLWYSVRIARAVPDEAREAERELDDYAIPEGSLAALILRTAGGLALLLIGADLLVDGAGSIARSAGVPESVIGLSLVAFGTSLPELVTAFTAARRGHCDVAMGTVLGSNMFNLLGVMGVTAVIANVPVDPGFLKLDLWVMLAAAICIVLVALKRSRIGRGMGLVFLIVYGTYIASLYLGMAAMHTSG